MTLNVYFSSNKSIKNSIMNDIQNYASLSDLQLRNGILMILKTIQGYQNFHKYEEKRPWRHRI